MTNLLVYLLLAVVGLFILVYGWVMLRAGHALRGIERLVETEGVGSEGTVTAHRVSKGRRRATLYFLTIQYAVPQPDGTSKDLTTETAVSYKDYDRYFPGEKVQLRYLKNEPGVVRLTGGISETFTGNKMRLNGILILAFGFLPLLLVSALIYDQMHNYALPGTPAHGPLLVPILTDKGFNQIFRFDLDGAGRVNLTNSGSDEIDPAWSPDGKQIAFASSRDKKSQIYVMNADGSAPKNLSASLNRDDHEPVWSPDGKYILFRSYFSSPTSTAGSWDLWVMDADGMNQKNLSGDHTHSDWGGIWSPDGKQIAFTGATQANSAILVINVDGTSVNALTPIDGQDTNPAWSPDGQQIAFIRGSRGNQDVWLIDRDGSNERQLTSGSKSILDIAWSPDGQTLAFIGAASGYNQLYTMNADGSDLQLAAPANAADLSFVWSPDSKQILVQANLTGGKMGVLMLVDVAGRRRTTIVDDAFCSRTPAWTSVIVDSSTAKSRS